MRCGDCPIWQTYDGVIGYCELCDHVTHEDEEYDCPED